MIPGTRTPSRRTARSGLLTTVTITVGLLTLTGCSGASNPSAGTGSTPSPTLSATAATATATGTPTPSRTGPFPPTPLGYAPEDPQKIGAWIEFPEPITGTPDEQAAIRVWRTYLLINVQAANTQGLNISTSESVKVLDAVAIGKGKSAVLTIVAARRSSDSFTVGRSVVSGTIVRFHGQTAVITTCGDDRSYEVDQAGKTVTPAPGVRALHSTLVRSGASWKVSDFRLGSQTCPTAR